MAFKPSVLQQQIRQYAGESGGMVTLTPESRRVLPVESATSGGNWVNGLVAVQGVLLVALGLGGVVINGRSPVTATPEIYVLGFQLNTLHSAVLLISGLAAVATLVWRSLLMKYLVTQGIVYLMLFVYGTAVSAGSPRESFFNLNSADNFLHAGLSTFAFVILLASVLRPSAEES